MQNGSSNTEASRGLLAGLLTFFLGPPLGGVAYTLLLLASNLILSLTGQSHGPSDSFGQQVQTVLLALAFVSVASYFVAWAPAAVSALYVTFRVGFTGWMSWTETVLLAGASLAVAPVVQSAVSRGAWSDFALLFACSLPSALALRYLAGRTRLVRKPPAQGL